MRTPKLVTRSTERATRIIQHPAASLAAIYAAAGGRLLALNPGLDNVGCTADTRRHADGSGWAI